MDKNTTIGFILIGLVIIGFGYLSTPNEAELREAARQDSIAAAMQEKKNEEIAIEPQKQMVTTDSSSLFFAQSTGTEQEIILKNEKVHITLSTKGGTIREAELLDYRSRNGGNVRLMGKEDAKLSFYMAGKQENIFTDNYYFKPEHQTDSTVTMALEQEGKRLAIEYSLRPKSYMVDVKIQTEGLNGIFAPDMKEMGISWTDRVTQQEKGYDFENQHSQLTYKEKGEGTEKLSAAGEDEKKPNETLDWIAFKNQFFSAILIAPDDLTDCKLKSKQEEKGSGFLKTYEAEAKTAFDPTGAKPTTLQVYLGPNDYHTLQAHNKMSVSDKKLKLESLIYFGWPIVRLINRYFIIYLFDWLTTLGLPMGYVLLLLTLIVKALVYPTTKKSFISGAKMKVLKPKVDLINAKYPKQEDAMKKQQEMMQLYSQYGVSPMGGCLPMLIQMPIWIALFNFVPNAIELRGQSFLWADDLSAYDDVIRWETDLWLIGDHLSIFCLLFCLTNVINTWISMRQQQNQLSGEQAQQMKMMQYMMYIMPLMFFFMFNNYSSGLCYYYFLSGLSSVLIMWYLRKTTNEEKLLEKLELYRMKHRNDPKKVSGMAARLEALQKQAQMMEEQRQRQKQN